MAKKKKDLVQIIKDNPGCVAMVDNDEWTIWSSPPKPENEMSYDEYDDWMLSSELCRDGEHKEFSSRDSLDGFGILMALAEIVGMKIKQP